MIGTYVSLATSPTSRFLREVHRELSNAIVPEMQLTLKVAVLSAAGVPRKQIAVRLEADELEVRMAMLRLQRIAEGWC